MDILGILFALSITLAIEPIFIAWANKLSFKVYLTSFIANCFLNVLMNCMLYLSENNSSVLMLFEIATIFAETILISKINKIAFGRTLLFTFLGNISSLVIGTIANVFVTSTSLVNFYYPIIGILILINLGFVTLYFVFIFLYNRPNKEDKANGQSTKE